MLRGMKKMVAFATAVVVSVAGFMIDNNDAMAEERRDGRLYYETTRVENQDNDIEPVGDHVYLYKGQEIVITGVDYKGKRLSIDMGQVGFGLNTERMDLSKYDDEGNLIESKYVSYLKDYTPESLDDYLVVFYGGRFEDGKVYINENDGYWSIGAHVYIPIKKVDSDGNETDELVYLSSTDDNNGYTYSAYTTYRYQYYESMYITDENGSILTGYDDVSPIITKATDTKETFGVRTINSGSSISASSDNDSVAEVKVSGRQFTVTAKKIGVANITVSDDAGNSASFQYMVVNPTAVNATVPSDNTSSSRDKDTSVDQSSGSNSGPNSGSSSKTSEQPVNEFVTVNSAGQTVRTFTTADGHWKSSLVSENDIVPAGATFTSKEIEQTGDYYIAINDILTSYVNSYGDFGHWAIGKMVEFDLADMSGAAIHQLDGYVTVSMDMPSDIVVGENQVLTVYRVAEDGTVVACPTVVENGVIQFATNHFSTYVFVVSDKVAADANNGSVSTKSPKTGE